MGTRWLQQKRIKMQRLRRAWAKPYSMRGSGPTKFPMAITMVKDTDGSPMRSVTDVGVKGRSKAAANYLDEFILHKYRFDPNSSEAIYIRRSGLHTDITVLARMNQSKLGAGSLQGEEIFVKHVCVDTPTRHLRMYISRSCAFFIEARLTKEGVVYLRSVDYEDKHQALSYFRSDSIIWDEIIRPPPS